MIKYTKEILAPIIHRSRSYAQVLRLLGLRQTGGSHSHLKRLTVMFKLDASHFLGRAANQGVWHKGTKKKSAAEILVLRKRGSPNPSAFYLRRALIEVGVPHRCSVCGNGPEWNKKPLQLQVDHKNGKRWDCRRRNLRFICPNCHTQTENFGRKNSKIPKKIWACSVCHGRVSRNTKTGMCFWCERKHRKLNRIHHAKMPR